MTYQELVQKAIEARKNSYSPYSGFKVGAALLTAENELYTGVNIENASYGLTVCAERTALLKAVSEGSVKFIALAVACDTFIQRRISMCACSQGYRPSSSMMLGYIVSVTPGDYRAIR